MEILLLIVVVWATKGAWDHAKGTRTASRDQRMKEVAGTYPKGVLPKSRRKAAARQHAAGWWAREVRHGFPVTKTGWHAAWLAHQTTADHHKARREEARTTALETRASVLKGIPEHKKRQAEAQAELDAIREELAAQEAKGSPATGRKAAREAADEVARKRAAKAAGGTCPSCGAPDGYEHLQGCDPSVPPLPADSVRPGRKPTPSDTDGTCIHCGATDGSECAPQCPYRNQDWRTVARNTKEHRRRCRVAPEVIDTPVRVRNTEDSDWLKPGEPRCEGCGGTGRNDAGNDACPVCRGWGGAPADPDGPQAAPGTICRACGRPGTREDPVVQALGGEIHRSHALARQESYGVTLAQLRRMRRADDERHAEIDDAVIGADHGFEGEHDTHPESELPGGPMLQRDANGYHPSPTTEGAPMAASEGPDRVTRHPGGGFDAWNGGEFAGHGSTRAEARGATASPITQGAPVTADTNYTTVLTNAKGFAAQADEDAVTARSRRMLAEHHAEEMQAAEVDAATLSSQMDLVEKLRASEEAQQAIGEHATQVSDGLQQRHGGLKQAHDDAPVRAAQRGFYEE
jgi:hypothetical protein